MIKNMGIRWNLRKLMATRDMFETTDLGPLICFHLWNSFAFPSGSGSASVHAEPVLLAVRSGGTRFTDGFTFTPERTSHRQPSEEPASDHI